MTQRTQTNAEGNFTISGLSAGHYDMRFSCDGRKSVKNMTGIDHFDKFTENVPAGWVLTNISCNQTTRRVNIIGADANAAFQPGDNTVTIDLNEANVTCTFLNQKQPECCNWSLDLTPARQPAQSILCGK